MPPRRAASYNGPFMIPKPYEPKFIAAHVPGKRLRVIPRTGMDEDLLFFQGQPIVLHPDMVAPPAPPPAPLPLFFFLEKLLEELLDHLLARPLPAPGPPRVRRLRRLQRLRVLAWPPQGPPAHRVLPALQRRVLRRQTLMGGAFCT
ncbi:hypothetical protein WJX74_007220 [Apatococcus lobatus]|uniref:Uncharacterized protein n=1 Tax=Apatococcus lobatus TaxID=904363 RepID=A0AAW1Q5J9_9CHLO